MDCRNIVARQLLFTTAELATERGLAQRPAIAANFYAIGERWREAFAEQTAHALNQIAEGIGHSFAILVLQLDHGALGGPHSAAARVACGSAVREDCSLGIGEGDDFVILQFSLARPVDQ